MTEIGSSKITDKDTARANLNHANKTFYRYMKARFKQVDASTTTKDNWKTYFTFDTYFTKADAPDTLTSSYWYIENIYTGAKEYSASTDNWSNWYDITEAYTGYVGYLNPATAGNGLKIDSATVGNNDGTVPFNPYSIYYTNEDCTTLAENITEEDYLNLSNKKYYVKNNAKRNNLIDDSNLVEAINSLDEILGSKTRIETSENGQVNSITNGSLSTNLNDDARSYYIPEDNVMDILVH